VKEGLDESCDPSSSSTVVGRARRENVVGRARLVYQNCSSQAWKRCLRRAEDSVLAIEMIFFWCLWLKGRQDKHLPTLNQEL
jgi:hypothetical protein